MRDSAGNTAQYAYDEALDALIVTVRGERSFELARDHFAHVIARMEAVPTRRVLLDLTKADYPFELDESVHVFGEIAEAARGKQIALVLDLIQREKGIVMQAMGTLRWNVMKLFHDIDEARAWLEDAQD